MSRLAGRVALVAGLAGLSMIAACSTNGSTASTTRLRQMSGSLTVLAAASLTEAFNDDKARLAQGGAALALTFSFEGSQQVVSQVLAGAPADVVATADEATMQKLVGAGAVGTPRTFARNRLEIAVRRGNPNHLAGLGDLARPGLRVVLADPAVPAGRYGRQALDRARVTVRPVSQPLDVKAALQLVASGEADAAIVYVTDVRSAGSAVTGVAIPDDQNVVATYPVALVKAGTHQVLAQAFVDQLLSGPGRQALVAHGFEVP
jgi:molybdate transport system substrate-binding protein